MPKGVGYKSQSGASNGAKDTNIFHPETTESGRVNEEVLPGTGSRYNSDGSKRELGVGSGP